MTPSQVFGRAKGGNRKAVPVVTHGRFSLDNAPRPEADRVELSLPMPPSSNALFANADHGGRFKTEGYQAWISEAGWRLQAQRVARITGAYEIEVAIPRPAMRRKVDLENRLKAISDLLVKHRIVADDSLAERITMTWGPIGSDCSVVLTRAA